MEEIYKLKEIQTKYVFTNKIVKRIILFVWIAGLLVYTFACIFFKSGFMPWFILAFGYSSIFGIVSLTMFLFPKNNIEYKYLKDTGKKDLAYIVDVGFSSHGAINPLVTFNLYYITVLYDNKLFNMYKFDGTSISYKILTSLLKDVSSYPIQKVVKIPIDVYTYKNKIYADFENVDLSKIEDFEEAKKIVESQI